MMSQLAVLWALTAPGQVPKEAVAFEARIEAESLEVGEEYDIVLTTTYGDGWGVTTKAVGRRPIQPFLQILVPDCAELSGRVLKTHRELSRNEFISEPFERQLRDATERIRFKLVRKPAKGEYFALNLTAYLSKDGGDDSWFIRRRLKLRLTPKAAAKQVKPRRSDWGTEKLWQIGDKAESFALPTADGQTVSLSDYLGKKNIIISTYRAHW